MTKGYQCDNCKKFIDENDIVVTISTNVEEVGKVRDSHFCSRCVSVARSAKPYMFKEMGK